MPTASSEVKYEEIIERLLVEQRHTQATIKEIQELLRHDPQLDGLTLLGSIKALFKFYDDSKKEIERLKTELEKIKIGKPVY